MSVPLINKTESNEAGFLIGGYDDSLPKRTLFILYVFVEGMDWGTRPCTDAEDVKEEKRIWLNEITKHVILASREGELPTNPKE
jgi:hypothetical protein